MRTDLHINIARDLPEDILRLHATRQDHFRVFSLHQGPRNLNDEDVRVAATKGDVRVDDDVRTKGVDTGCQKGRFAAEDAAENTGSEIGPRGIGVDAPKMVYLGVTRTTSIYLYKPSTA
jgi:hypothetical protein